jgi:hypothetical protein
VPDFATLRLAWERRLLSILRIMVGVLYMKHGLAKILDFPHQPNHGPYSLFTLVPGRSVLRYSGSIHAAWGRSGGGARGGIGVARRGHPVEGPRLVRTYDACRPGWCERIFDLRGF